MKRLVVLLTLIALLVLASSALAMRSDNFWLDWFTPLDTGGGGGANSPSFTINYSIGQTAIGSAQSTNYGLCLGYWCEGAVWSGWRIYLPGLLHRSS